MKTTTRTMLAGLAAAAALAPGLASARPAELGENVLTILYPATDAEGNPTEFDIDYYRDHHLPLIMDLYPDSISRFELIQPQPTPAGAPPAPYVAVVNIYISDQDQFDADGAEHGATLQADVPNFSSVNPMVVTGTIYGLDD